VISHGRSRWFEPNHAHRASSQFSGSADRHDNASVDG
jgi:hypothetical protein